jgi:hypothetical protein
LLSQAKQQQHFVLHDCLWKYPLSPSHRYQKSKIDSLRFIMCPLQAPIFQGFFFAEAINSTNEANKAGSTCL